MISAAEKKWIGWFALTAVVVTTIPYALGFSLQNDLWRFSGFIVGIEDGNSYIAKMLQGSAGEWLFRSPYSAFEQKGMFAFFPYILLGKLVSPPGRHDQLIALFQLFRWGAIFLYAFAAYGFIRVFLKEIRYRKAALILVFFGGGLGFLAAFGVKFSGWDGLPLEFYSPEAFGFLAVFSLPHIAAGRAFLLWGLTRILTAEPSKPVVNDAFKVGVLWTALGMMQPLTVIVGWAVLSGGLAVEWLVFRIRNCRSPEQTIERSALIYTSKLALLSIVFSAPIPAYTFLAFQLDSYLKSWAAQNLILSPPPLDYLLAYGLILPFVLVGAARVLQVRLKGGAFLIGWTALFPFLAYAPYNLQRRLPEGIWVCLVVLALAAVELSPQKSLWRRSHPVLYLGLFSSLFLFTGGLTVVSSLGRPLYIPAAEVVAFERIELAADRPFPVVLADYSESNHLPAWIPARVLIGHGPESKDLAILQPQAEAFLNGAIPAGEARVFAESQQVDFVMVGPNHSNDLSRRYSFLEWIDSSDGYRIYKVVHSRED